MNTRPEPADPALRDPRVPVPSIRLIAAMPALSIFASLVYMPSIESMAAALAVGPDAIQHTVTIYLAAMSSFALLVGPLSDRFGRRLVSMLALSVFALGSLFALMADSIGSLLFARLLQGIGASGGIVLPRSMVRDALHDRHAARASATIAMTLSVVPMVTPLIGGHVQEVAGWRANFAIVAVLAIVIWIVAYARLNETLPRARRYTDGVWPMLVSYAALLANRQFMVHALPIAFGAVAIFSYQTEAPVLLIANMKVPPTEYGYYAAMPALGFFAGTALTRRFALTVPRAHLIETGCALYIVAGAAMAALAWLVGPDPWLVALPMVVFGAGNGLVMPNASVGGMSAAPMLVGCAAALSSSLRMGSGSVGSMLVTQFPSHSAVALGAIVAIAGAIALLCWLALGRGRAGPIID